MLCLVKIGVVFHSVNLSNVYSLFCYYLLLEKSQTLPLKEIYYRLQSYALSLVEVGPVVPEEMFTDGRTDRQTDRRSEKLT